MANQTVKFESSYIEQNVNKSTNYLIPVGYDISNLHVVSYHARNLKGSSRLVLKKIAETQILPLLLSLQLRHLEVVRWSALSISH
jgi:hypothetical protein